MELNLPQIVKLGLLFVLLLLLLQYYWSYKKKITGFPFYHILPYFIYCLVTRKISEDALFNNVAFEKFVQLGKRHIKEGLFMTFVAEPFLFIFNEELIKIFANDKAAMDKPPLYKMVEEALGSGIGTSNGERWRTHRKVMNPAFNVGMLKEKVTLFNDHATAFVKDMENFAGKPSVDILHVLKLHYFNALSESVLGLKQSEENKELVLKIGRLTDNIGVMTVKRIFNPWLRWRFMLNFFSAGRKFLQDDKECVNDIANITTEMKKVIFSNRNEDVNHFGNHLRKSLAYLLLNHHLKNPNTFSLEDVHHEMRTIIGTGFDTVSFSTLWCLYLLGLHPEFQEKIFTEIESTTSEYITYEESGNLTYLEAAIMESLRIYPTIPLFARTLSEDIQCGKYKVFNGTTVGFFPYLSHRNPNVYPDPEKFEPERFLNPETRKTWNYIPFSEGSRMCIGKNYGLLEMKIFLAHFFRNFKITSLDRREDIKLCYAVALYPTKHLRFKITKRHTKST